MCWKFSLETIFYRKSLFWSRFIFFIWSFYFFWTVSLSLHPQKGKKTGFCGVSTSEIGKNEKLHVSLMITIVITILLCLHVFCQQILKDQMHTQKKMRGVYSRWKNNYAVALMQITGISKPFMQTMQQKSTQKFCMLLRTRKKIPCYQNKVWLKESEGKHSSLAKDLPVCFSFLANLTMLRPAQKQGQRV